MAKLEFTDWSEVQWRFGSGEIAIFRKRMIINPSPPVIIRVKKASNGVRLFGPPDQCKGTV